MFESLEDDTPSAVKTKIEKYNRMQLKGTIYYSLKFLLDSKLAESFGIKVPALGDYRAKIGENSIDFYTNEIGPKIKKLSEKNRFFHWELEFPNIFFDERGNRKSKPDFDIIIGNPPYVSNWVLSKKDRNLVEFLDKKYDEVTMGHWDLYIIFVWKALSILKKGGYLSFIVPSSFSMEKYGKKLREHCQEFRPQIDDRFWSRRDL